MVDGTPSHPRRAGRWIERTLVELVDLAGCHLVLTTGGTGPAPRDVTPEATLAVAHKVMPGFGEEMRRVSLKYVPTAILSRQVAVVRGRALIVNLPGQPKAIKETLDGVFPRSLLHRSHRRPVHRDERRRLQGLPAEERDPPAGMKRCRHDARNDA
jgi:molybdopterin biosynthesis enzyme MoaB